jgi:hypothetical protein
MIVGPLAWLQDACAQNACVQDAYVQDAYVKISNDPTGRLLFRASNRLGSVWLHSFGAAAAMP